jgi:arginase
VGRPLALIGVPTSAGAFAPGQEQAPRALRGAGLLESLQQSDVLVHDRGDREAWRWRPDRENRRAQNLHKVVEIVRDTARRVAEAVSAGEATLVLGGDCTTGIGTVAGQVAGGERVGLVYFDTHADLNVPSSVREGALDWMGLAHMLGEEGAAPELVNVGSRTPLLDTDQVTLFAWGSEQATPFERAVIDRRAISVIPVDEVAADPERAAQRARELIEDRCDRLLLHFDVDVIDFTDVPLSENWGRNEGLAYDHAMKALQTLLASPRLAGMTITELNPDHTEQGADSIERFAAALSGSLAGAPAIAHSSHTAK